MTVVVAGRILKFEILNFKKFHIWSKTYENCLEDQWLIGEHKINSTLYRLYANGSPGREIPKNLLLYPQLHFNAIIHK